MSEHPKIEAGDHDSYIKYALSIASHSPPKPTNFRVGAVLVDELRNEIISTGYTLELEGNTHAEQVCLLKISDETKESSNRFPRTRSLRLALYTTMEPCNKRASGNMPCVDRILETLSLERNLQVRKVYTGVSEPEKFVGAN